MRLRQPQSISFINAQVLGSHGFIGHALRVSGGKVASLNRPPERGDAVVDLAGDVLLPGMINAHDHLELNNFPRLKWRECYANAGEWIDDFQPRFETDAALRHAMSVNMEDRLFLGGIKNLLSGVTTACHHNPLYRSLRRGFPIRVVERYRFSHSLKIDGDSVRKEFLRTPPSWPWIIHAAEGTDDAALREFFRLQELGCLQPNTLLVHGVALGCGELETLGRIGAGLVWCPSSNHFLLGTTLDVSVLCRDRRVALGTDSRLTGERDMLGEIRFAAEKTRMSAATLLRMVTTDAASLLRLREAGDLRPGVPADLLVVPRSEGAPADSVLATDRSTVRLVMIGGATMVGDPDMKRVFEAAKVRWEEIRIDCREKLLSTNLANRMKRSEIAEPGLEL